MNGAVGHYCQGTAERVVEYSHRDHVINYVNHRN